MWFAFKNKKKRNSVNSYKRGTHIVIWSIDKHQSVYTSRTKCRTDQKLKVCVSIDDRNKKRIMTALTDRNHFLSSTSEMRTLKDSQQGDQKKERTQSFLRRRRHRIIVGDLPEPFVVRLWNKIHKTWIFIVIIFRSYGHFSVFFTDIFYNIGQKQLFCKTLISQ